MLAKMVCHCSSSVHIQAISRVACDRETSCDSVNNMHTTSLASPVSSRYSSSRTVSGLWGLLPEELIETILVQCSASKLAMLQTTCTYFHSLSLIDQIARNSLKVIPRARSLKPCRRQHETYPALLHFVNRQSAAAAQATAIACGGHHTSALLEQRGPAAGRHALYTFGRNLHGQSGRADFEDSAQPQALSLGFRPCQDNSGMEEETMAAVVSCGAQHSMCMSRRGELFSWGLCKRGELGQGRWAPVEVPVPKLCLLTHVRVVSVSCGASHSLAIGESGSLWSCGNNSNGQLGHGNLLDSPRMQLVQNLPGTRIVSAAAGAAHSVALASDGSLYTWGDGSRGQLGHSQLQAMIPHSPQNTIVVPLPQKVACLDPGSLAPDSRVTAMSARGNHTLVLTVGGTVLAFGANDSGCLGLGDFADRWRPTKVNLVLPGEEGCCIRAVQVACGARHSLVLVSKQGSLQVRTSGVNMWGQLGIADCTSRCSFSPTVPIPRVAAIVAGDDHSAAVTEEGNLYVWGRGDSGQLGLGDVMSRCWPSLLGGYAVVHPDKTLRRSKRNMPYTRQMAPSSGSDGESCMHFY